MATIVLCGGGSAGHTIPHIALLPHLKKHFLDIHYIGSRTGIEKDIISEYPEITYHAIECTKLRRSLTPSNLLIPVKLLQGISQSRKLLRELKPSAIFSKGGYVSLPVVLASGKIPVILHESDLSMGLANKLAAPHAKVICTSFPATAAKLNKGVHTGTPLRPNLLNGNARKIIEEFRLTKTKPTLTVIGGSLGAAAINTAVRQALSSLTLKYEIIHITGKNNLNPSYNYHGYHQAEYRSDINDIFAASDLVVSRAGSNTIFELLALRKPMLLIPLPKGASRGDQIQNARNFTDAGLSHTLLQEELTASGLIRSLDTLNSARTNLINAMTRFPNTLDASQAIVKLILTHSLK